MRLHGIERVCYGSSVGPGFEQGLDARVVECQGQM